MSGKVMIKNLEQNTLKITQEDGTETVLRALERKSINLAKGGNITGVCESQPEDGAPEQPPAGNGKAFSPAKVKKPAKKG